MLGHVAAVIILVFLFLPVLALVLVVVYVLLRLVALGCTGLADCLEATIPEEQRRWAEEGPDQEEMRMIEDEIKNGNISLT